MMSLCIHLKHSLSYLHEQEQIRPGSAPHTFDSPGDEEEPALVVFAEVPGVQPAVVVQGLLRPLGHVEVPHEDVAAPEADLAVALLVRVVQLRLAARDLFAAACGATTDIYESPTFFESDVKSQKKGCVPGELEGLGGGDGVRPAALAHAVQLVHGDVQAEEELQGVFGDGGGARVAPAAAVQAQGLAHLFEHQLFG